MASKEIIQTKGTAPAVGPYNHAVRAGNLLFCAGQIPLDPNNSRLVEGDVQAQTDQVFRNIQAILTSAGLSLDNVVKTTVFLTDLNDFSAMNEIYARHFTESYPARTTIQVAGLPKGARVEIEIIAHFPEA